MNQTAIGGYIARKRKEQNLTQEQLAQQLGVSNKTISPMRCTLVSNKIIQARERLGLTQQQLAEKLCVTNKAVSKWECGVSHS